MTGAKPEKREEKLTPQGPAVNFVLGAAARRKFQAGRVFAHFGAMQQPNCRIPN